MMLGQGHKCKVDWMRVIAYGKCSCHDSISISPRLAVALHRALSGTITPHYLELLTGIHCVDQESFVRSPSKSSTMGAHWATYLVFYRAYYGLINHASWRQVKTISMALDYLPMSEGHQ